MKRKTDLTIKKYLYQTKEESDREISEMINGKPHYSDSQLAFGLALKFASKKIT